MPRVTFRFGYLYAGVIILIMVMSYLGVSFRIIDPLKRVHAIAAGDSAFVLIPDAYPRRSRHSWPALRVEFESSSGLVDVYVVQVSLTGTMRHKNHIDKLKEAFAAGMIPKEALHLTRRTGTFRLKDLPKNIHYPNYMLMIRGRNQTEVTVTVRY